MGSSTWMQSYQGAYVSEFSRGPTSAGFLRMLRQDSSLVNTPAHDVHAPTRALRQGGTRQLARGSSADHLAIDFQDDPQDLQEPEIPEMQLPPELNPDFLRRMYEVAAQDLAEHKKSLWEKICLRNTMIKERKKALQDETYYDVDVSDM